MAELTPRMKELVQPYLAGIEPYDPNFTPTRINLSANENTYPVPAGVREAIDAALAATPLNRYPDPMSNDLRDELAAWHGVTRENICVGNGGDELLYNYLLAFGGAGRTLLNCPRALASMRSLRRCARPRCATCGATRRPLNSTRRRCLRRLPSAIWRS